MKKQTDLSQLMQRNDSISSAEKIQAVWSLALPAILAQIAEIVMQYIDSAMVGSIGAQASASIGLVSSTTWLIGGMISACASGFSVQTAQAVGAKDNSLAKSIFRQSFIISILFSLILMAAGTAVSSSLPAWLGAAEADIRYGASQYFLIYALFLPIRMIYFLCQSMLQCSGDMKTPSILGVLLCIFDVFFNFFLIFPARAIHGIPVWGAGLGVTGAALGTAFSYIAAAVPMAYCAAIKSPVLNLRGKGSWKLQKTVLKKAASIGIPMGLEQAALSLAQVFSTRIVAPLGTVAIAANSFAVTAEAFCYMPGYGIGSAATTLTGQAAGANRKDLAKSFAWLSVFLAMVIMTAAGILMYFLCPAVFAFLTPDPSVQRLGIQVLRIELHAEPLFAASIVASGAMRGTGDTFVPFLLNLISMWGVRLTLASILSRSMGLTGVWTAMAIEISFRGILFLIRLKQGKWLNRI